MRTTFRQISGIGVLLSAAALADVGVETSSYERLADGEEFHLPTKELIRIGEATFSAEWTPDEGAGRPLTKGTGAPLSDPTRPLVFPHSFNRISAMDANSCAGCHNQPFGRAGGGGDFVTGVFVAAQRFDFATLDGLDAMPGRGALDEAGAPATVQTVGNYRATIGMFGSGFIEMLARQMTSDLQALRDSLGPGDSVALETKGVSFGTLSRAPDGSWDIGEVDGLPPQSLLTGGGAAQPSLVIHPFHQSGSVVSIRQFTNNAFNHHHGMQSTERFGENSDPDGDGVYNELTRADITAASVFQATLPVPSQVIPKDPRLRQAVAAGQRLFEAVGCGGCHRPTLPLTDGGWVYTEPNPYNPAGNLRPGEAPEIAVDLTDPTLPAPRLKVRNGVVEVPAFTDLKLHDISSGVGDPNAEPLNINHPGGSPGFLGGNRQFLTKKLWGAANEKPFFHHGRFTTFRQAIAAHFGEAEEVRQRYDALADADQAQIIEFLKSLQVKMEQPQGKQ
jgi:mono/diheme cytochrome c family protein